MRCLALVLVLTLGACDEPAAPPLADDSAYAMLAPVDRRAVADAFARLAATDYEADLAVTLFGADGTILGRETAVLTKRGDEIQVAERSGDGILSDASDDPIRLRDPLDQALSDDPPYLDPAVREAYRAQALGDTVLSGTPFQRVEARLVDTERELGVARVWAAVDGEGNVGAVEVQRVSDSAIFDEASTVRVELGQSAVGWVPRRVVTDTQTDVPLSAPRHVRIEWTIRPGRDR